MQWVVLAAGLRCLHLISDAAFKMLAKVLSPFRRFKTSSIVMYMLLHGLYSASCADLSNLPFSEGSLPAHLWQHVVPLTYSELPAVRHVQPVVDESSAVFAGLDLICRAFITGVVLLSRSPKNEVATGRHLLAAH